MTGYPGQMRLLVVRAEPPDVAAYLCHSAGLVQVHEAGSWVSCAAS